MSKYSDFLNSQKVKQLKFFFGEDAEITNDGKDILKFKHYINDNELIVITNNIKTWKDQFVLVVNNNKVVFLKSWQVQPVKNWEHQLNAYAVKLNRNFFKTYELKFDYDDMHFTNETTFDELVSIAKEQDKIKLYWKLGHYNF